MIPPIKAFILPCAITAGQKLPAFNVNQAKKKETKTVDNGNKKNAPNSGVAG